MLRFIVNLLKIKSEYRIIIIDGRFWHNGRTGIGRVSELFIKNHSNKNKIIVIGPSVIKNKFNVEIIETNVDKFGPIFLFQNVLLNILYFRHKSPFVLFPHYFSTGCFLNKIIIVHDLMALTHYNYFFQSYKFIKKLLLKLIIKVSLINANVLCPSMYSKNILLELFNKKSIFIPNGSLLYSHFSINEINNIINVSNSNTRIKTVGYVGNLRLHKNIDGIKSFCKINNFQLIIFSDYKPHLDRTDDLLVEFYIECDAIIMLSYCEGFGIPLIEAAMIGKYIFASNIPPFLELYKINLNYVDSSTIVNSPIKSNPIYTKSFYSFDQLNSFINDIYMDLDQLPKFMKLEELV